jgi:hypothetical protein
MISAHHWSPVPVFRITETGKKTYIKVVTVEKFLKKTLVHTYLDPHHRLCHLEQCFMSHCLIISACLALASAVITKYEIMYYLRWNINAVDLYIPDQLVTNLSIVIPQGTFMGSTACPRNKH